MHPILGVLELGPFTRVVPSYGVMLSTALLVGASLTTRGAARAALDPFLVIALVAIAVGGGLAGSYALFVGVEWVRTGSPMQAFHTGGLVFYGGLLGGAAALAIGARRLRVPLPALADVAVPGLAAAHALGRIGCFLAGCCYGRPWSGPLAVTFTDSLAPAAHPSVQRHPVQLYESGALLLLALAFTVLPARVPALRVGSGRRALAYVAAYAVLRLGLETFRGDADRGLLCGVISTSQLVALALLAAALLGLLIVTPRSAGTRAV